MSAQQTKRIEKQLSLPIKNAFQMSVRSIRIRFGRSIIVTMSIVLGIAFLMSVMSSNAFIVSLIKNGPESLKVSLQQNLDEMRVRQLWLVSLSLLVCVVGIINAMLMSVTERSREIGTMKCLGALDRFVVEIFIIESSMQGLVGSVVGVILGIMVTFLMFLFKYKGLAVHAFPGLILLKYTLFALVLGTVLSVVGALYPAYVSAKMEPAEAMRREV